MNDHHEWLKRCVTNEDAWLVQQQLEGWGFQVATVDLLPTLSKHPTWRILHACRPPLADPFEAAQLAMGSAP